MKVGLELVRSEMRLMGTHNVLPPRETITFSLGSWSWAMIYCHPRLAYGVVWCNAIPRARDRAAPHILPHETLRSYRYIANCHFGTSHAGVVVPSQQYPIGTFSRLRMLPFTPFLVVSNGTAGTPLPQGFGKSAQHPALSETAKSAQLP